LTVDIANGSVNIYSLHIGVDSIVVDVDTYTIGMGSQSFGVHTHGIDIDSDNEGVDRTILVMQSFDDGFISTIKNVLKLVTIILKISNLNKLNEYEKELLPPFRG